MCQRLNTGESYNFYFGIFICCVPLILYVRLSSAGCTEAALLRSHQVALSQMKQTEDAVVPGIPLIQGLRKDMLSSCGI